MRGMVFDIQRFSLHDGPGIRTTVFLKGCPLRCMWCHNPESWEKVPQLLYSKDKCTHCLACVGKCPNSAHRADEEGKHVVDLSKCKAESCCIAVCDFGALKIVGKEMSVEEVIAQVVKDKDYYKNSGGGLTLSGGEPMLQHEFAGAIMKEAKRVGIHTCMETSGYASQESYASILSSVDLFLFDYKATGRQLHKRLTGVENGRILSNLDDLLTKGAQIILRCPMIPGINDGPQHFEAIAALSKKYDGIQAIEILPYHDFGKNKWEETGKEYFLKELKTTSPEVEKLWRQKLLALGCEKCR